MFPQLRTENIGKRIVILMMNDPNPVEPNTMGTIMGVDDIGQYQVKWDNGRSLSVIPEEDQFVIIEKE
jgi:hypothetical protein